RAAISRLMLGASAHAVPAVAYTARPASSTRRRPRRSESGPQTSCAAARPARKSVTVSCAVAASEPKAAVMAGSDGRNMSIDSAPRPTIAVSSTSSGTRRSFAAMTAVIVPVGDQQLDVKRNSLYRFRMKSVVSSKGQITLPMEVRTKLGLVPGTPVHFEVRDGVLLLRKGDRGAHAMDAVFGTLRLARPVDALVDEMRGPRPA